jgi:limonene-1,2-epoxide hydrolase
MPKLDDHGLSTAGAGSSTPEHAQRTAEVPTSVAVVEELFDALHAQDAARVLALLSDDIVYQNVPWPADRGKARAERTLRAFMRVASKFEARMHNIAGRGDVVLTERTDILKGRFVHLEFWVCGTFEVRDGKITLWRDYTDSASLLLQLLFGRLFRVLRRWGEGQRRD